MTNQSGIAIETKPAIFETAIGGWRHAFVAFSRMPLVLGAGMLVSLVVSLVTMTFMPLSSQEASLGYTILSFAIGIVQGYLLTPVAIAVHRFVLLGEIAPRYALTPSDPRFMRFFGFTVIIQLMMTVPNVLMTLGMAAEGLLSGVLVVAFLALFIVAIIASLRLMILFPAIAVDAAGADWRNAMEDTKGHSWRVFFIVVVASLPLMAIALPLSYTLAWPTGATGFSGFVFTIFQSILGVLSLAAFAAIASRLFAIFANRLNGPAAIVAA